MGFFLGAGCREREERGEGERVGWGGGRVG